MSPPSEMQTAMVNRSIRTIKAELEFLCDANVITPQALNELLSSIPEQTALRAPLSVGALPGAVPSAGLANLNLNNTQSNGTFNEKSNAYQQPAAAQPPPSYNAPPPAANWPPLCTATALYAYTSTDAGDLALQPNDQITVTEYMNAEWWKGRSVRTGQEGIFPRSYVKIVDEKAAVPDANGNNYGNMPLQVSNMGNGDGRAPSKFEGQAKKVGSKLGNAAIFGAGATIGSNLVNSIF